MMLCFFFLLTILKWNWNANIFSMKNLWQNSLKEPIFQEISCRNFFASFTAISTETLKNIPRSLSCIILNLSILCFRGYFIILVQTFLCTHLNNFKFGLYWFSTSSPTQFKGSQYGTGLIHLIALWTRA